MVMSYFNRTISKCIVVLLSLFLLSCSQASNSVKSQDENLASASSSQTSADTAIQQAQNAQRAMASGQPKKSPSIEWQPSYSLSNVDIELPKSKLPPMPVGATIRTKSGKVPLAKVMKELIKAKNLQLSWASDVKQDAMVDVNILPDDDFWTALNNLLRQLDYTYEFKSGAVVIKHKITKKFMLPMPFLTSHYKVRVGGDLLGASQKLGSMGGDKDADRIMTAKGREDAGNLYRDQVSGMVFAKSYDHEIDIWQSIQENLDKILQLAATRTDTADVVQAEDKLKEVQKECEAQHPNDVKKQGECTTARLRLLNSAASLAMKEGESPTQQGKGGDQAKKEVPKGLKDGFFYTIDKPLGIVTVTAPNSILEQIDDYFKTLTQEVARQVIIEAKILEVTLKKNSEQGIDWTDLLNNANNEGFNVRTMFGFSGETRNWNYTQDGIELLDDFTPIGAISPMGKGFNARLSLSRNPFGLVFDFLNTRGNVKVLSNPKLTMMNGQPSVITVGESVKYISKVTADKDDEGITYSVETDSILSGLAFGVMASITEDNEVVMQLTPITSALREPMEERQVGLGELGGALIGLPRVAIREMTTMAKVKSGELLIVGGLIDETTEDGNIDVPYLSKIPGMQYFFGHKKDYSYKRELIILLRPQIITL